MVDVKSIFASKTLWGLVIAAVPTALSFFGYNLTDADAAGAVSTTMGFVTQAMTYFGWVLAFYGRVFASKTLAVVPK